MRQLIAGFGLFLASILPAQQGPPTLVLTNGHIYTADPTHSWVQEIAIRGDKIEAVSDSVAIAATARSKTVVIDLHGRMAMPGINDAHAYRSPELP